MSDYIDGYKQGFKEGVQAFKIQLKEKAYGDDGVYYLTDSDIDEICKELEGENGGR